MLSSCIILLITYLFITPTKSSSNETDLLALLDIKARIDHDPSGSLTSWNESTHFCTWNGIQCSHIYRNRVVAINLLSQGLVGSLSPQIGNLSFLSELILTNNFFQGEIPQEMSRLTRLETINLSNNYFSGPIPRNLSRCVNLVYLNLVENRLSGFIPPEIGSWYKLEVLDLAKNNLSGNIPPSIGNLTSLVRIYISYCRLEGEIPESLTNLRRLTYFRAGVNYLTGIVPSGLFNISTITTFTVHSNKLEGEIPSELGLTLPNLRELCLGDNRFTGKIPDSISNASNLEQIILPRANFTGTMPKIGNWLNLRVFTVAGNHLQNDISFITSLTNCTKLQFLAIGDNFLTGSLPRSIGNLSNVLETLEFPRTQIHGKIPSSITNLVGLTRLSMFGNFLDGHVPSEIGKLYNLREINFGENRFTNELPFSFKNLTRLIRLSLSSNNFSGGVQVLSKCTNLLELDLSYNQFNGLIPSEIMNLESISILLDLSNNMFTGSIPHEIGSLSNLIDLDLSNNLLSGFVPNTLSKCKSLQRLYFEGNSLEGEITPWLNELMGLEVLDLSRNMFSGLIPSFLSNFSIKKLNLSYNKLRGEVPMQGIFVNNNAVFLYGNDELCGGILELKFPPCSLSNLSEKKTLSLSKKILIPSVCLLFATSFSFIMFVYRRKAKENDSSSLHSIDTKFMRLSYGDLSKATDGFSNTNIIGCGKFGTVYKGVLEDKQTLVAVKVLNLSIRGASDSFIAEYKILRCIKHRNLVKILSVCKSIDFQQNDFKTIVYAYKSNGSLEKWLYPERKLGDSRTLSTFQSLSIAIDVANALAYLHYGTESIVVHGDLKPSNIVLDHDLNAFVGDFGLAKIVSSSTNLVLESNSSVSINGTIGYIAPEYATSYTISIKGDVYSYGILLLEMFTNKSPIDEAFEDHVNLHNYVCNALRDQNVIEIVDPLIRIEHDTDNRIKDCVVSVLSIGVECSRFIPSDRILMTDVVNELHKIRDSFMNGSRPLG